jgi:predicted DNA-binding transcriptional regulator AlpA
MSASAAAPETMREPLVGVREVAEYLSVNPSWVYEHAAELGARRLPTKPRKRPDGKMTKPTPRLRFSLSEVDQRLSACTTGRRSETPDSAQEAASRRRRRRPNGQNAPLLPIRGRIRHESALRETP